ILKSFFFCAFSFSAATLCKGNKQTNTTIINARRYFLLFISSIPFIFLLLFRTLVYYTCIIYLYPNPNIGGDLFCIVTCSIQLSLLFHLFQCYLQPCGSWSNFFLILLNFYTICPDPSDGL